MKMAIALLLMLQTTFSFAGELEEKMSHSIGGCKWSEAIQLIKLGANPFGATRETSPFEADISACYNSIKRLALAYSYDQSSDAFELLKTTVLHEGFLTYRQYSESYQVDEFFETLLKNQQYGRVRDSNLIAELEIRGLFYFKFLLPDELFSSDNETTMLKYIVDFGIRGGFADKSMRAWAIGMAKKYNRSEIFHYLENLKP